MMFCCGFSSATMRAGCHNKISRRAAMALCRSQRTPMRQLRRAGRLLGSLARSNKPNPTAIARNRRPSIHRGQFASRTNSPLAKAEAGYLNKNSNILPGAQSNCQSVNGNQSECCCHLELGYIGPIFLPTLSREEVRKRGVRAPCLPSSALSDKVALALRVLCKLNVRCRSCVWRMLYTPRRNGE